MERIPSEPETEEQCSRDPNVSFQPVPKEASAVVSK